MIYSKTLLKLAIPRIKLLRNRREIQMKQMRREIAKLLETGQEASARIRVEHILREEKMMAAQEIIELFCELISVRLPIIEAQRECPLDLKEAISSVCFAAPRCADVTELVQVQMLFAGKYGKEFVAAATELMPECGVNRQLIELLSVRAPGPDVKLKLLKEIALEHELEWDPSVSETELSKPHEDLLVCFIF
nr:IST1-like protein [Ipomoea batatas]